MPGLSVGRRRFSSGLAPNSELQPICTMWSNRILCAVIYVSGMSPEGPHQLILYRFAFFLHPCLFSLSLTPRRLPKKHLLVGRPLHIFCGPCQFWPHQRNLWMVSLLGFEESCVGIFQVRPLGKIIHTECWSQGRAKLRVFPRNLALPWLQHSVVHYKLKSWNPNKETSKLAWPTALCLSTRRPNSNFRALLDSCGECIQARDGQPAVATSDE